MINYKSGDLLKDDAPVLVNTVNTVGVMGKGIALAFKNAFPNNYVIYRKACKSKKLNVGILLPILDSNLLLGEKMIINFPTKTHWSLPSEYEYIKKGLLALRDWLSDNAPSSIALPALGCVNGGSKWPRVKRMIEDHLAGLPTDIRVYLPV